jgi:R3H domain
MLDLPPQNSYERLLAHKLADYYNLAHYSAVDNNCIRLYKSVEFRL